MEYSRKNSDAGTLARGSARNKRGWQVAGLPAISSNALHFSGVPLVAGYLGLGSFRWGCGDEMLLSSDFCFLILVANKENCHSLLPTLCAKGKTFCATIQIGFLPGFQLICDLSAGDLPTPTR